MYSNTNVSYRSIVKFSMFEEVGELEICALFVGCRSEVFSLDGLTKMVVEEVQNPISIDEVFYHRQVEGRPNSPGNLKGTR